MYISSLRWTLQNFQVRGENLYGKGRHEDATVWFLFLWWFFSITPCFSLGPLSSLFPMFLSFARILFAICSFLEKCIYSKTDQRFHLRWITGIVNLTGPRIAKETNHWTCLWGSSDWTDWGWDTLPGCVLWTGVVGAIKGEKNTSASVPSCSFPSAPHCCHHDLPVLMGCSFTLWVKINSSFLELVNWLFLSQQWEMSN